MRKAIPVKPDPDSLSQEEKCNYCTISTCCTYVTQELDTPRSMEDFDTLLWQVSHENIQAYKDEGSWYLLVNNRCRHLGRRGRCKIYDIRPQICREHSNEDCEFDSAAADDDFDLFFPDYESLDKYCRKRYKSWDKRWKHFAG